MKIIQRALWAALLILSTACHKEPETPETATLEIDAPAEITFKADGTGGMEAITVTTNQTEWEYTMDPADGALWLTAVKENDKLRLTAAPNTETTAPASVKISFTAGDAPERATTVKQLAADAPAVPAYSVDDLWPDDENPEGIVFWIDPASSTDGGATGTTGWVMSLEQAPELPWCANYMETDFGTNSDIDGRINYEAIWAYDAAHPEYTGTFRIFEWCRENYDEQWYIPSLQEMRRFLTAYAGLTPEQTEAYMTGRRLSALPADIWFASEDHRRAYDMRLIEVGGDGLWDWDLEGGSIGPQLWTSTKYDVDNPSIEVKPWYVEFLGGWGSASTQGQHDVHFTRAMRRFGTETVVDELTVTPTSLTFGADETTAKTVTVTTTAAQYEATVSAPWIHISKSAGSFSVRVDEYTEAEAEIDNYENRMGWITVGSGNAPAAIVEITQVAPTMSVLDLAGTWDWTGEIWDTDRSFTSMSGTATAVYNEELGSYVFTPFYANQGMTDLLDPADRVDGSIALRVNEYNQVEFVSFDKLDRIFTYWGGTREYYNYVSFYTSDNSNIALSGLAEGTVVVIGVSNGDGNTITFPATGMYEGVEHTYGFGFGYHDLDPSTLEPASYSTFSPGGVFRNLVLTRAD